MVFWQLSFVSKNWCFCDGNYNPVQDTYHQAGFRDTRLIKFIVYGVFVVETLQLVMATHDSFHTLALGWGNFSDLLEVWFTWFDLPFLTGLSASSLPNERDRMLMYAL